MTRFDRRERILAAILSALAGYVDAIGFIELGGFFVSFMSGNSTRLAVGLAHNAAQAREAAFLLSAFVAGVVLGALAARSGTVHRRGLVLSLVASLLALAAALGMAGHLMAATFTMAVAMGAENAVFAQGGEVQIGLTYMTGTLVKLGQKLADALLGGPRLGWTPYLFLWLGLLAGAVLGALACPYWGFAALWPAAALAAACAIAAHRMGGNG